MYVIHLWLKWCHDFLTNSKFSPRLQSSDRESRLGGSQEVGYLSVSRWNLLPQRPPWASLYPEQHAFRLNFCSFTHLPTLRCSMPSVGTATAPLCQELLQTVWVQYPVPVQYNVGVLLAGFTRLRRVHRWNQKLYGLLPRKSAYAAALYRYLLRHISTLLRSTHMSQKHVCHN